MATSVDVSEFSSATAAYEYFADTLLQSAHSHVPRTSGQPNRPVVPWWNKSCAVHKKITRICYKRYRRYPSDVNRISYCRARAKQKRAFKEARRESWENYISSLTSKTPPKLIWDKIRKLQGKFSPSPLPILKIDNNFITHHRDVAETLAGHFAGVSSANHYPAEFQAIRDSTRIVPPLSSNTESYNLNFSVLEFESAISKSSPTSPGEDEILYSFVSHLPVDAKNFLLDIYN